MYFYARLTTCAGGDAGGLTEEIELHPDGRLTRTTGHSGRGGSGGSGRRSAPLSPPARDHARALVAVSGLLHPSVSDAAWPPPDPAGPGGLCELEVADGDAGVHVSFATTRAAGCGSAAEVAASPDPAGLGALAAAVADFRAFALAALAMHNTAPAARGAG